MLTIKIDGNLHAVKEVGDPTLCGIEIDYSNTNIMGELISSNNMCEDCQTELSQLKTIFITASARILDTEELIRELGYEVKEKEKTD